MRCMILDDKLMNSDCYIWKSDDEFYTSMVYSDRLYQWNPKLHDELCQKYFGNTGQYWNNRTPVDIQSFLGEYLNLTIKLVAVAQHRNKTTDYPYWSFFILEDQKSPLDRIKLPETIEE